MSGWVCEWIDGYKGMGGCVSGWIDKWVSGWGCGCMDRWMCEWLGH
jgi:hypothetical protein